jgi:putative aldouronate transport system permease protein
MAMRKSRSRILFDVFLYAFFVVVGIACLYPFLAVLVTSILPYEVYLKNPLSIIPRAFSLSAYKLVFNQENILRAASVSVYITVVGTLLSLIVTTATAYALSKRYLKGRRVFLFLFIFTMLFEGGIIPLYFVARSLGIVNTLWALMLPLLINTFFMLIMRSFFLAFPDSLEESAKLEGANDIAILMRIVVPLSKAVIAVIGLFYAVERWNDFFYALMFLNRQKLQPLQLLVYNLISPGSGASFAQITETYLQAQGVVLETIKMAAVIIAVVPILIVYPFIQRHFTKGILIGSIKG